MRVSEFREHAAWDEKRSLDGRSVRLTGFIVHDGDDVYMAGCERVAEPENPYDH